MAGIGLAGLLVALVLPEAAAGQEYGEDPPVSKTELTGYAGVVLPMSSLGSEAATLRAELSTKPAFAASVEFWIGGGFGLGVMGGFGAPDLTLTSADPESGAQDVAQLGSADYLHGEVLLLWRPELTGSAAVLLPYFGAGAGIRRLDFDEDSGFEDTSDVALALNAGAQVRIAGRVHMRLDVRDLVSTFEGGPFENDDLQHDVLAQVGFGIGF